MYTPRSGVNAAKANKKAILAYLEKHPNATGAEIAKETGLSRVTVYSHLKEVNTCIDKKE